MGVSILLICAVLASLSAGVLFGYGVCVAMFKAFHIHATRVTSSRLAMDVQAALEN